jgi:hypothetical protein
MFRGIPLVQGSRWYMGSLGEGLLCALASFFFRRICMRKFCITYADPLAPSNS